jgi:hypothetical protein
VIRPRLHDHRCRGLRTAPQADCGPTYASTGSSAESAWRAPPLGSQARPRESRRQPASPGVVGVPSVTRLSPSQTPHRPPLRRAGRPSPQRRQHSFRRLRSAHNAFFQMSHRHCGDVHPVIRSASRYRRTAGWTFQLTINFATFCLLGWNKAIIFDDPQACGVNCRWSNRSARHHLAPGNLHQRVAEVIPSHSRATRSPSTR